MDLDSRNIFFSNVFSFERREGGDLGNWYIFFQKYIFLKGAGFRKPEHLYFFFKKTEWKTYFVVFFPEQLAPPNTLPGL